MSTDHFQHAHPLGATGVFGAIAGAPFVDMGVRQVAAGDPGGILTSIGGAVLWAATVMLTRVAIAVYDRSQKVAELKQAKTAAEIRVKELELELAKP